MAQYTLALDAIETGHYQKGIDILTELGDFRDSLSRIEDAKQQMWQSEFAQGEAAFDNGNYNIALDIFNRLKDIEGFEKASNAKTYVLTINANRELYTTAVQQFEKGKYIDAYSSFEKLGKYEQSEDYFNKCNMAIRILQNSTTISAGVTFSAAVTEEGRVVSSGYKVLSQADVADWTDIISISVFGSLAIGLKVDGTVVTADKLPDNYRIETGNWEDIVAVSAGDLYIVGLRANGTLVAQGHNGDGQIDVDGEDWVDICAVSTGWRHTVALTNSGDILIAGIRRSDEEKIRNDKENWHDIIAVAAGGGYPGEDGEQGHTVGLRRDGTVVAIGDRGKGQCNVEGWEDIIAIAAGAFHTVGLTKEGKVVTTQTDPSILKDVNSWESVVAIAAGYGTTFALDRDGNIYSTGYFFDHQRDTEDWGKLATHEDYWLYISMMQADMNPE